MAEGARGRLPARCWFVAPADLLLRGLARLPQGAALALAGVLAMLSWPLARRRLRIARTNLRLCFPELDEAARARLLRANLRATLVGMIEMARAWYAPSSRLAGSFDVEGLQHLEAARRGGRGVLLLTGHTTHMDLGARLLGEALGERLHPMVRGGGKSCSERLLLRGRLHAFAGVIGKKDVRGLLRTLSRGGLVAYLADQNFTYQNAFVPFFGVAASTLTTTPELAARAGVEVLPYWLARNDDGRYRLRIDPPWRDVLDDPVAFAARYMAELEKVVRRHPEQYLWIHRRFKTRPPGEADIY